MTVVAFLPAYWPKVIAASRGRVRRDVPRRELGVGAGRSEAKHWAGTDTFLASVARTHYDTKVAIIGFAGNA